MNEKDIAQEILIMRSQRGWTQQELANRIQTTQRTVVAWESGDSVPRKAMRVRIAKAFDLPEDYFLTGREDENTLKDPELDRLMEKMDQLLSEQKQISEEKKALLMDSISQVLNR